MTSKPRRSTPTRGADLPRARYIEGARHDPQQPRLRRHRRGELRVGGTTPARGRRLGNRERGSSRPGTTASRWRGSAGSTRRKSASRRSSSTAATDRSTEILFYGFEGLAVVAGSRAEDVRAAQLWGVAAAIREATGYVLGMAEQRFHDELVPEVRARLGDAAFDRAWSLGRQLLVRRGDRARATPGVARPSRAAARTRRAACTAFSTSSSDTSLRRRVDVARRDRDEPGRDSARLRWYASASVCVEPRTTSTPYAISSCSAVSSSRSKTRSLSGAPRAIAGPCPTLMSPLSSSSASGCRRDT